MAPSRDRRTLEGYPPRGEDILRYALCLLWQAPHGGRSGGDPGGAGGAAGALLAFEGGDGTVVGQAGDVFAGIEAHQVAAVDCDLALARAHEDELVASGAQRMRFAGS